MDLMNIMNHNDFKTFLNFLTNGKLSLHEPIISHNPRNDELQKQSFLDYLKHMNQNNYEQPLHIIFNALRNKINSLKKEENVHNVIFGINGEWFNSDGERINTMFERDPISEDLFDDEKNIQGEYKKTCHLCDNIEKEFSGEAEIPFESQLRGDNPVNRSADSGIILCHNLAKDIKTYMKELKTSIHSLKSIDQRLLLDLSLKQKSSYMLNNIQDNIPDNIHRIFINFLLVHNLLYKQLLQIYKRLETMLNELKIKCERMNTFKKNIHISDYLKDIDKDQQSNIDVVIDDNVGQCEGKEVDLSDEDEQAKQQEDEVDQQGEGDIDYTKEGIYGIPEKEVLSFSFY